MVGATETTERPATRGRMAHDRRAALWVRVALTTGTIGIAAGIGGGLPLLDSTHCAARPGQSHSALQGDDGDLAGPGRGRCLVEMVCPGSAHAEASIPMAGNPAPVATRDAFVCVR